MKNLIVLFIFFTSLSGQCQVVGKIYIGDDAMDVASGPDHLEFEVSKSDLSTDGEAYLKYFVDTYGTRFPKSMVSIIVAPPASMTKEESEKTAMKRIEAFEKFFKKTPIKIAKGNFKEQTLTCILRLK